LLGDYSISWVSAHRSNYRCGGSWGDDTPENWDVDKQRRVVYLNIHMRGLNDHGGQSEQLRICSIKAGRQLSVPRLELGIAQGSCCLGHSVSLCPKTFQSCIYRTELAL
jgi:hypothetical protein